MDPLDEGNKVWRKYKRLNCELRNIIIPALSALMPGGMIPSGKNKDDILLQLCQNLHRANQERLVINKLSGINTTEEEDCADEDESDGDDDANDDNDDNDGSGTKNYYAFFCVSSQPELSCSIADYLKNGLLSIITMEYFARCVIRIQHYGSLPHRSGRVRC